MSCSSYLYSCKSNRTEIISRLSAAQHTMSENNVISAFDLVAICSTTRGQNCPSWLRLFHSSPHCSRLLYTTHCAFILATFVARSWTAAEPQYRRVSSFLSYFPVFSSEHCVPCDVMYDMACILCDATMSPSPLSHTHVNNMYYSSLHHKLEPSVQDVYTK